MRRYNLLQHQAWKKKTTKGDTKNDTATAGVWACSLRLTDLRHRYDVGTGSWYNTQESTIHRIKYTQYSWEERTRVHVKALLWRTIRDTDTDIVQRASGSVLCLGELQHETSKAVLFHNLEGPLRPREDVESTMARIFLL